MTARSIYLYEVELQLQKGGESKPYVRKEHAYNVTDAIMQAAMIASTEYPGCDAKLVRVGPPAEAIREAEARLLSEVRERMSEILGQRATDAVGTTGGRATVSRKV